MRESSVVTSVRDITEELKTPREPNVDIEWVCKIEQGIWRELSNPKKGKILHRVARSIGPSGVVVWDQPVFVENPGLGMCPVRRIKSGKGRKEDLYIVYMVVVQRPIMESKLNLALKKKLIIPTLEGLFGNFQGVTSIEFPRGIAFPTNFSLSAIEAFDQGRMYLLGDQQAFDAAGGFEELQEEIPQLMIHPNFESMLIGGLNPNTSLFQTTQGEFIVPVQPDTRLAMEKAETSASQGAEQIKGIIPLVFPSDTDYLLREAERIVQTGIWAPTLPILLDSFTKSLLAQLARLIRENRIPVTG
jgi:hypothetical protein